MQKMNRLNEKLKELFGIDTRSLAILRIGLALVLLMDLFIRIQDLSVHYSDEGLLPRNVVIHHFLDDWHISLHLINGTWQFQFVLFILEILFAISLLLGFRTRLSTILSWILLISLQTRNPLIIQGGDTVLRMLLFWGMFLPLGSCWSMDHWLKNEKTSQGQVVSAATVALLLQVCCIYWFSAFLKTDATWRQDGTAVWYALSNEIFATSLGRYLLNYPVLLQLMTFSTMFLEFLGPFFAFSPIWTGPLRFATVLIFILFHLALNFTLELGLFSYICIVAWTAFLPRWFWNSILSSKQILTNHWKMSGLSTFIVVVFFIQIFIWNLRNANFLSLPTQFNVLSSLTRVDQYWNMFAPFPLREDGWLVIPAKLRNGKEVDLLNGKSPVSWEKPELCSACFKNDRWRSLTLSLTFNQNNAVSLSNYANYLSRHWNENHLYEENLFEFEIVFLSKSNDFEKPVQNHERIVLWKQISL